MVEEFDFKFEKQKEIQYLAFLYKEEAKKCYQNEAYLSGCILIGAALEALLLSTITTFPELARGAQCIPKSKGKIKKLDKWSLGELIAVAKEVNWLPSELRLSNKWKIISIEEGNYFEVIQKTRNLVHPTQYVKRIGSKKRITKKHLLACFEIVNDASKYLSQSLEMYIKILKDESRKRKILNEE